MRVLLLCSLLGLGACATPNALPADFNSEFEF